MKAVLVIDMPRNCWGCPCNEVDSDGMSWCNALAKNTIHSNVERQPWCPLRPLPQKKNTSKLQGFGNSQIVWTDRIIHQNEGWNDCLDEIVGETE